MWISRQVLWMKHRFTLNFISMTTLGWLPRATHALFFGSRTFESSPHQIGFDAATHISLVLRHRDAIYGKSINHKPYGRQWLDNPHNYFDDEVNADSWKRGREIKSPTHDTGDKCLGFGLSARQSSGKIYLLILCIYYIETPQLYVQVTWYVVY